MAKKCCLYEQKDVPKDKKPKLAAICQSSGPECPPWSGWQVIDNWETDDCGDCKPSKRPKKRPTEPR